MLYLFSLMVLGRAGRILSIQGEGDGRNRGGPEGRFDPRHQRRPREAGGDGGFTRLIESFGYADVRTLLNSGNVVFTAPRTTPGAAADRIETALAARLGVSAP